MAEEYRTSPQWQALNRIWKAVPQSAREGVKADFKTVTDFVKATYVQSASETPRLETPRPETRASAAPQGETNFLAGLSPQARKLALTELTRNGFDIYGFLAELLRETRAQDAQEMFDAYLTRRDVEDEQVEPLMEIIRACMARREGRA